ncbi:hypothetical protein G6F46_011790 [Rhizopus delemar]|uniref:RRM domain-containing protein n=2 Tax=Rhizopus TaxID=4842 RepID=A0A9P6YSY1_9FUNG|nr:hypothetical protein G6F43_001087 [Rhizopus delemar]KAG1534856.1 hypothetical protein G6F51_011855 [Rhizopus arrhizus]KAG1446839.1 hypothetical protein G6F55_011375 [Rhizopus delemar]KAG1489281.1 hypothetical protein G6F54_011550 [Rhizopus delemar]KAG1507387.1 hypothetical protein G6F53_008990 [Rhizopus delemar]
MSQIPLPLTPLNTTFYNKSGLMNGDGEQLISPTKEDISTIFVVGFPEDMQEREFQNMFMFSSGFEAATLKVPSSKDGEEDMTSTSNIKKQIIGFAKFRTRKEAIEAKDTLNGRKIDAEKGNTLKAEMAKKNLHTKKANNNGDHHQPQEQQAQVEQEEHQKLQQPIPSRFNTTYEAFYSVPPSSVPKDLMSPVATPSSMINESYTDFYSDLALVGSPPPAENSALRSQSVDARSMDLFVRPSLSNNNRFHSRLSAVAASRFHNKELEFEYLSKSTPTNDRPLQPINPHAIPSQHYSSQHVLSPPLRPLSTVSTGLMNHDPHHFSRFHQSPFIHTSNSTPPKALSPVSPPPPGILSPNHSYRSLGGMLVGSTNPADQNPPCNTLYVGNLPPDANEEELKSMFSKCAGYKRLSFRNKSNGPMCFVEFEDAIFAAQALQDLHGNPLSNSVKGGIRLSFSKNPLGVRQNNNSTNNTINNFSLMNTLSNNHPQLS